MPLQTFRYAACGGGNTVLGFLLYSFSYTFLFHKQVVNLGFYAFKPHVAALIFSFLINFPVGFLLMKFVVFIDSNIRGRVQLFRYFFVFISNLFINYVLLRFLVEYLHLHAIIAQVLSTTVVIIISYLLQRHFTFKVEDTGID
ncbi:MAG: GtrA family protein [Bacteroidota bacterium]|nr:GtrA family protein [Bacteroidota bacterium]